jgi:hypothetical protein
MRRVDDMLERGRNDQAMLLLQDVSAPSLQLLHLKIRTLLRYDFLGTKTEGSFCIMLTFLPTHVCPILVLLRGGDQEWSIDAGRIRQANHTDDPR